MKKEKYRVDDFQGLTTDERMLVVLIAQANELHNIYSVLWELKEKK